MKTYDLWTWIHLKDGSNTFKIRSSAVVQADINDLIGAWLAQGFKEEDSYVRELDTLQDVLSETRLDKSIWSQKLFE